MPAAPNTRARAGRAAAAPFVPFWALAALTWLNSLGSGVLWSGLYFATAHDFAFSAAENLWLSATASAVYCATARLSGRLVRALRVRTSTRGVLVALFAVETAAAALALDGAGGVVACALVTSAFAAMLWPIVESYLASGRHGAEMRSAIGRFNLTWMSATAASLVLMAPILGSGRSRLALAGYGALTLVSLAFLPRFPAEPAPHHDEAAEHHVPPSYAALLAATRWLLPLSYLFVGALGPLMPYFLAGLGVPDRAETPLTATWMVARLVAAAALARIAFWHGRWSTLGLGALLLFGGFAAVALAPSVPAAAVGLFALGAGQGTIYYASLYYAMAVGRAAVDAGGAFESLVGLGYLVGPLMALVGQGLGGGPATVACVWVAALVGLVPVVRAWRLGRR